MNSALQCLVNCEALVDYFLGFDWPAEINRSVPAEFCGSLLTIICIDSLQIRQLFLHKSTEQYGVYGILGGVECSCGRLVIVGPSPCLIGP